MSRRRSDSSAESAPGQEKRQKAELDEGSELERLRAENRELREQLDALLEPIASPAGAAYNMDDQEQRRALAVKLWSGDYATELKEVRVANPKLYALLRSVVDNTYRPADVEKYEERKQRMLDGTMANLIRAQSQKKMPLLTAALSIVAHANNATRELLTTTASYFRGALATEKWTADFLKSAVKERPPPEEQDLPGVELVVFDNLTMQAEYKSYVVSGEGGRRIDMTNWVSVRIPRSLAPTFDADKICARPPRPPPPSCMRRVCSPHTRTNHAPSASFAQFGRACGART